MTKKSNVVQFDQGNTAIADPSSLANVGAAVAVTASQGGGADLMRLLKEGEWAYGADDTYPEEDSQWAINPYSIQHGFISWVDSKVAGEVMCAVTAPLPPRGELPDTGESWDDQLSFGMQCVSGEDDGTAVLYKTTSVGGKRCIGKIANAIAARAQAGETAVVPVVALGVDSYKHKQYGKIFTPEMEIVEWRTLDGEVEKEAETAAPEEKADDKPAPRKRRSRK